MPIFVFLFVDIFKIIHILLLFLLMLSLLLLLLLLLLLGSGKTFSYVWPMIVHVINQPQMKEGDGPIGIVLAPTRELIQQIYTEMKKFTTLYNIRVTAVYGGPGM